MDNDEIPPPFLDKAINAAASCAEVFFISILMFFSFLLEMYSNPPAISRSIASISDTLFALDLMNSAALFISLSVTSIKAL